MKFAGIFAHPDENLQVKLDSKLELVKTKLKMPFKKIIEKKTWNNTMLLIIYLLFICGIFFKREKSWRKEKKKEKKSSEKRKNMKRKTSEKRRKIPWWNALKSICVLSLCVLHVMILWFILIEINALWFMIISDHIRMHYQQTFDVSDLFAMRRERLLNLHWILMTYLSRFHQV